jgi:hypothetical protein
VNALRLADVRTSPATCCELHEYALQSVRIPIQQSHYERVYEVTLTLRETSQLGVCKWTKPFGTRAGSQTKGPSSERMSASEMIPTSLSPSRTRMRSS